MPNVNRQVELGSFPAHFARRIDHIAIATTDADASAAWYLDALGMVKVGDERVESAGVRLVYLVPRGGDGDTVTMLQLVEPFADGPVAQHLGTHGEGLHHVCFTVDDIDALLSRRSQDDVTVFMGGRQRRACFLSERPLGVNIELTETYPIGEDAAP